MTKNNPIKKYLTAEPERRGFQTRVDTKLLEEVNQLREREGLSWQQLTEALFKLYISESKKEKANA